MQSCATKLCTNPGPLEIPVVDPDFYRSTEDAKRDARCGPCVFAIHKECDGLTGDELHEKRFAVLQTPVFDLRPQQYPVLLNERWVYECCLTDDPRCKHTVPGVSAEELVALLHADPWVRR